MGENTKIEWCDHTWNPWIGCTKVSVGPCGACESCYAEDMMDRRYGRVRWGAGEDRVRTSVANWREPYKWNRIAQAAGSRPTVFCLSLGDIWDNEVDPMWRREAFDVMNDTPHLTYLLLSKRIGNAVKMCDPAAGNPLLPRNAALGATMVTQEEWDRDMPKLRHAGEVLEARFTFASVEPMLGEINASGNLPDWVIVGGESGSKARPMHPTWARSLRDQCVAARIPFHFKQHGEWFGELGSGNYRPASNGIQLHSFGDGYIARRVGKKAAGRLLDGQEWNEMPERRQ